MSWIVDWLLARSRLTPEHTAIIDIESKRRFDFQQLNQRASRLAWILQSHGVGNGERVCILAPNHLAYIDLLFACAKLGAIFVPLNWRLSERELEGIVQDCTPRFLVFHSQFIKEALALPVPMKMEIDELEKEITQPDAPQLSAISTVKSTNPWMILYTGGTTGKPKGVVISHQAVGWNAVNTVISWGLTADDITPVFMPMFHTGGLNALTIPLLYAGGTIVIVEKFLAEQAIQLIEQERCTIALLVPTMYHLMIQSPLFSTASFSSIRTFLSGAAPCPQTIYDAFASKGIPFKEGYGLTEAGPNNFQIDPKKAREKRGSIGLPMLFNEVRLQVEGKEVDKSEQVGEIWIRGGHLFDHYWKNPEATKEVLKDGWLCTGDLGKRDHEGYYYIVGRKKDMIITGGENVYPLEVEKILIEHPDICEVVVVGLPDERWGEVVTAVVVLKPQRSLTLEGLQAFCTSRLGKYKIPKKLLILDELPKTMVGKIDKKGIVQKYG